MLTFEFTVEHALTGIRIDSFLAKHLRNYNTWRLQRFVAAGGVTINNSRAEQTDRVFSGQRVTVKLIEPPDKLLEPDAIAVPVVYQDPWLMVINKPAGLICHPVGMNQDQTLANALQYQLDQQTSCKGLLRPGIVHRLDKQTSGAMVVALTHAAHAELSSSFEASRVSKSYLALVEGRVAEENGTMNWPIGRAPTGRHVLMSCLADARSPRPSRTQYSVLKRFVNYTLVLATPRTGRNHQIRVHFARLGHPLVGDEFYMANGKFHPFYETFEENRQVETGLPIKRHALHAYRLNFAHPITNLWMSFCASLPDDFGKTLKVLSEKDS